MHKYHLPGSVNVKTGYSEVFASFLFLFLISREGINQNTFKWLRNSNLVSYSCQIEFKGSD